MEWGPTGKGRRNELKWPLAREMRGDFCVEKGRG